MGLFADICQLGVLLWVYLGYLWSLGQTYHGVFGGARGVLRGFLQIFVRVVGVVWEFLGAVFYLFFGDACEFFWEQLVYFWVSQG